MKDAYGLAKRFAAMPPRWGWIKDVARLIEQDRREVRSEERKACAERFCNYCNPEGYDPALPCCTACDGRAVILAGKVHIAREGI